MYKPAYDLEVYDSSCEEDDFLYSSAPNDKNLRERLICCVDEIIEHIQDSDVTITLKLKRINQKRTWFKLHSI